MGYEYRIEYVHSCRFHLHDEKKQCSKRLPNTTIFEVSQSLKQTVAPKVLVVYMFLINAFCSFSGMTFIYQQ